MKQLREFMAFLGHKEASGLPVIFSTAEGRISPDYHLTEVRLAVCKGMDCGGEVEQWTELQIQLLDGDAVYPDSAQTLPASKINAILRKASAALNPPSSSRLVFELTTNGGVLGKWQIGSAEHRGDRMEILLAPEKAQCKPASRQENGDGSCCGSAQVSSCCETACCA